MALIVEDGTGLLTADAYISVSEFKTWCSNRGYRWEEAEDFAIENAIRLATGYIDTLGRYKGFRLKAEQTLEFPRESLIDWSSHLITGVPHRVKQACSELAFKSLSEPLYKDLERGGRVTSESVGPISVSYAPDAPAGKLFAFAKALLEPYLRDPEQILFDPQAAPNAYEGTFAAVGMHDNPGQGALTAYGATQD